MLSRQAEGREWSGGDRSGVEGTGVEWRGGEGREGEGRTGQGRVPDCLGGLSRVGISSRSTRPWNGQPPSSNLCCRICPKSRVSFDVVCVQSQE